MLPREPCHYFQLRAPEVDADFVVADGDYLRTRAAQCRRLANVTEDQKAAGTLRRLADAFEETAKPLPA